MVHKNALADDAMRQLTKLDSPSPQRGSAGMVAGPVPPVAGLGDGEAGASGSHRIVSISMLVCYGCVGQVDGTGGRKAAP